MHNGEAVQLNGLITRSKWWTEQSSLRICHVIYDRQYARTWNLEVYESCMPYMACNKNLPELDKLPDHYKKDIFKYNLSDF
jgi:hypothetical protein